MPRTRQDLVDSLAGDVEGPGELGFARSRLVSRKHRLAELLPSSVKSLQCLVGDSEALYDGSNFSLMAHRRGVY